MKLGLVDVLGNLEDAVDIASDRAGIKGVPQLIYSQGKGKSWLEKLFFAFIGEQLEKVERRGLRYEWSLSLIQ